VYFILFAYLFSESKGLRFWKWPSRCLPYCIATCYSYSLSVILYKNFINEINFWLKKKMVIYFCTVSVKFLSSCKVISHLKLVSAHIFTWQTVDFFFSFKFCLHSFLNQHAVQLSLPTFSACPELCQFKCPHMKICVWFFFYLWIWMYISSLFWVVTDRPIYAVFILSIS